MGNGESIEIFEENELEQDVEKVCGEDANVWRLFQQGYDVIIDSIIQPPRHKYTLDSLGPMQYPLKSTPDHHRSCKIDDPKDDNNGNLHKPQEGLLSIHREDFKIPVQDGHRKGTIEASIWMSTLDNPHDPAQETKDHMCLVYLHSNLGSRQNVVQAIRNEALRFNLFVLAFDFLGCGHSSEGFISAGKHESRDLDTVLEAVERRYPSISRYCLWGHSLGASAALMLDPKSTMKPKIMALVLDSPITSLSSLTRDMLDQIKLEWGTLPPQWMLSRALKCIASSIEKRTGVHMSDVCPIDRAKRWNVPALVLSGSKDQYVPLSRVQEWLRQYGPGKIELVRFEGLHYQSRPKEVVEFVMSFVLASVNLESTEVPHE